MDTTTRRTQNMPIVRRQLLKGAVATGVLAAFQMPELARVVEADAAAPSLVGAWIIQTEGVGPSRADLTSFSKDGLIFDAGSVPLKVPPSGQSSQPSVGLGTWAATTDDGFDVTFVSLSAGPKGDLQGTTTINAHVSLGAGGETMSGTFTITAVAEGGPIVFSGKGTLTGKRIKARSM